jgi:hypothetical protein
MLCACMPQLPIHRVLTPMQWQRPVQTFQARWKTAHPEQLLHITTATRADVLCLMITTLRLTGAHAIEPVRGADVDADGSNESEVPGK